MAKRFTWLVAVAFAPFLLLAGQEGQTLRASTLGGCEPSPAVFRVQQGSVATRFRIQNLRAGQPCGEGGGATEGFSIRRGSTTVFVYYYDSNGEIVSDPCPLNSLELEAGSYALYAAPASGAAAVISFALEPATK
ncbi:MAG: hypothetical protein JHC34_03955 [Acidobacteria bacterium]|nr:hypothetical protein [Acidobacteriota bacterium]